MSCETIAIDGPAASGKSTVGKKLSEWLGYLYFDTGVMYRAVTLAALKRDIDIHDEDAITRLSQDVRIDVTLPAIENGRSYDVFLDGEIVTHEIHQPEVDENVSIVSAYPGVRAALTVQQRRIGSKGKVVMLGRDIGTVVLPEADLKIYLDASVRERAARRYQEYTGRGETASLEEIEASMRKRDRIDSTRDVAPLKPADDAVIINTDKLTINQVLSQLKDLVETACE